ncbi:MAG: hypothetical protein ACK4FB_08010 [Brevundimonas sp.]|uniref:hypothetical protein n=1 Tax=Brevundimonas sp. TaxID=1871086 RepID=UPI00391B5059
MTRASTIQEQAAGKIDAARAREVRGERDRIIADHARTQASAFIGLNDNEQTAFAKHLIRHAREDLMALIDAPGAAAFLSSQAYEAGKGILPNKIAKARAEQMFTRAANEGEGE